MVEGRVLPIKTRPSRIRKPQFGLYSNSLLLPRGRYAGLRIAGTLEPASLQVLAGTRRSLVRLQTCLWLLLFHFPGHAAAISQLDHPAGDYPLGAARHLAIGLH